jgi:hypothetical protein
MTDDFVRAVCESRAPKHRRAHGAKNAFARRLRPLLTELHRFTENPGAASELRPHGARRARERRMSDQRDSKIVVVDAIVILTEADDVGGLSRVQNLFDHSGIAALGSGRGRTGDRHRQGRHEEARSHRPPSLVDPVLLATVAAGFTSAVDTDRRPTVGRVRIAGAGLMTDDFVLATLD